MNKNAFAYTLACIGASFALIGLTTVLPAVGYMLAILLGAYGVYALSLHKQEGGSALTMAGLGLTPALAVTTFALIQATWVILALFFAAATVMAAVSIGRRIYPK